MELTELDKKLQEIAITDWRKFMAIVGEDAILNAKVCILRRDNKSYAQISVKLRVTPRIAQIRSGKCDCADDEQKE